MSRRIIPRDLVARQLAVSPQVLVRYESLGLVQVARDPDDAAEGYEPAQIRRLWTIVSFQRDMGINLAGVEVILHLCDQMREVHRNLHGLANELHSLLDPDNDLNREEPSGPANP
jgi:MerR family transcriptional regulator/heat shock protein HspR